MTIINNILNDCGNENPYRAHLTTKPHVNNDSNHVGEKVN